MNGLLQTMMEKQLDSMLGDEESKELLAIYFEAMDNHDWESAREIAKGWGAFGMRITEEMIKLLDNGRSTITD